VTKYLSGKSPSDVSSLTDSEEFVQEMVDNCNGPEYFSSPKRFKEVLERVVREIGMSNEAG
jgi:hypothetical protein